MIKMSRFVVLVAILVLPSVGFSMQSDFAKNSGQPMMERPSWYEQRIDDAPFVVPFLFISGVLCAFMAMTQGKSGFWYFVAGIIPPINFVAMVFLLWDYSKFNKRPTSVHTDNG